MIKVICNKCGKEISKGMPYIRISVLAKCVNDGEKNTESLSLPGMDFCQECMNDDIDFSMKLYAMEDTKPEMEMSLSVSKHKRQKKQVDYGKIMALRNAKWSNVKIAEEMGMTPNAVAQAIYKCKRKEEQIGGNRA